MLHQPQPTSPPEPPSARGCQHPRPPPSTAAQPPWPPQRHQSTQASSLRIISCVASDGLTHSPKLDQFDWIKLQQWLIRKVYKCLLYVLTNFSDINKDKEKDQAALFTCRVWRFLDRLITSLGAITE